MSKLTCPVCGSNDTDSTWVDNSICGEYEWAECLECGEEWNECSRDYYEENQEQVFSLYK
jgi:Zn ribbon nucleic-acid-binding protein